ncbi:NF-kappa-B-repressing factor [Erpetoichthys calabaricus]|uniref:NFKB repressing factor n=1 Tax=Erpetoichthys calabaricus TaxID=27687 RepID=A0A8C4SSX8_ERPCA|nr:NF-kappa-B-repressing factor [Erpetoichthys calabaricus]
MAGHVLSFARSDPTRALDVDVYRLYSESDKQWAARRHFIVKHATDYRANMDQLLSLSMVWVNHIFMGCRYNSELLQKVISMAEGIDLGEMPSYELVPGSATRKRTATSNSSEEPAKKQSLQSKCGPRPRFEPVHFVSSTGTEEKENAKDLKKQGEAALNHSGLDSLSVKSACYNQTAPVPPLLNSSPFIYDSFDDSFCIQGGSTSSNFMTKLQQEYTAKFEAHKTKGYEWIQDSRVGNKDAHRGLGFVKEGKLDTSGNKDQKTSTTPPSSQPPELEQPQLQPVPTVILEDKQNLIRRLSSAVSVSVSEPGTTTHSGENVNYNFILSRCIQACKTNPEYFYVPLKEIPPADLPKNRKLPIDGYACELRCQCVYLATGYSGSKNGARDRASEQAYKLLLKPVEVQVVWRKYKHTYINDFVVCQKDVRTSSFPPALRNPEEKSTSASRGPVELDRRKHWTEFVVVENALDAICILNNSAAFNRMKIEYRFDMVACSNVWQCSIYLQEELVAQATGNKKTAKHKAAEAALQKLRTIQSGIRKVEMPQQQFQQLEQLQQQPPLPEGRKRQVNEVVILENSDNAICIINDTAQFNKMTAEYKFIVLPDCSWKCEVYLEGQYIASGIGQKKIVKHIAAENALSKLRQTQPVVKSNLWKDDVDAISRNQIRGISSEEAMKQEIKEDNIGNQLLRKMGWKGGGLGREGEGIAEPIKVKEQFTRQGLGLEVERGGNRLNKRDIEEIIKNYVHSERQDELRFSTELTNDERKQIHQIAHKYGLRSKSYGQGMQRFLIVGRKVQKEQLIDQLLQEGQVGRYELVKPQPSLS